MRRNFGTTFAALVVSTLLSVTTRGFAGGPPNPAEGHGFSKRENEIGSIRRTVEWFDKYLKGGATSQASAQTGQ